MFFAVALQSIEAMFITPTCKFMTTYGFQLAVIAVLRYKLLSFNSLCFHFIQSSHAHTKFCS